MTSGRRRSTCSAATTCAPLAPEASGWPRRCCVTGCATAGAGRRDPRHRAVDDLLGAVVSRASSRFPASQPAAVGHQQHDFQVIQGVSSSARSSCCSSVRCRHRAASDRSAPAHERLGEPMSRIAEQLITDSVPVRRRPERRPADRHRAHRRHRADRPGLAVLAALSARRHQRQPPRGPSACTCSAPTARPRPVLAADVGRADRAHRRHLRGRDRRRPRHAHRLDRRVRPPLGRRHALGRARRGDRVPVLLLAMLSRRTGRDRRGRPRGDRPADVAVVARLTRDPRAPRAQEQYITAARTSGTSVPASSSSTCRRTSRRRSP